MEVVPVRLQIGNDDINNYNKSSIKVLITQTSLQNMS